MEHIITPTAVIMKEILMRIGKGMAKEPIIGRMGRDMLECGVTINVVAMENIMTIKVV